MIDLLKEPLFADVLAHPDDEAPRLVLADRLIEAGDPRGEFIQFQCALETEKDETKASELAERAKKLLKKYQPVWNKPIKAHVRSTIYRRGFVEHYLAEPKLVFDGLAIVARHTPIRGLRIQSMKKGDATRLAKMKELLHLRSLDIGSNRIEEDDAIALSASPHLASLRSLTASRNPIGDAAVEALARSTHLARLTQLGLVHVGMGARGIAAIAAAPFIGRLERLAIDSIQGVITIDRAAFMPLARAPLGSLRALSIWNCTIGDEGARALAESPHLGKLEELRCVGCEIGSEGMRAIARSKTLGALRWFEPFAGDDNCPPDVKDELTARFGQLG